MPSLTRRPRGVNSHSVAKYLLSRAGRNAGFKVVLIGEGSDEILGDYFHFRRGMPSPNGNVNPSLYDKRGLLRTFASSLVSCRDGWIPLPRFSQNAHGLLRRIHEQL
jgi:hypothetical protein